MTSAKKCRGAEECTMISAELLHTLRTLPRADKLYLMQFLVSELAQEESDLLKPGLAYSCVVSL